MSETLPREDEAAAESERGEDGVDTVLRVEDLHKNYGGITELDGATFGVERASMTGLIGPNGAGKSTMFNLVTGIDDPDAGSVWFQDEEITDLRPYSVANRGLVRTFQIARELANMTVLENLMLPAKAQSGEALWRSVLPGFRRRVVEEERELRERVWETLEFFEIEHLAEEKASNLSGGQRKLLELSRALMLDPDMLMLDEPFAGVNPTLQKKLLDHVHELNESGHTFLIVEHDMDLIMNNCERVIVMHQGKVLTEGTPADIRANEEVIEAYLGGDI